MSGSNNFLARSGLYRVAARPSQQNAYFGSHQHFRVIIARGFATENPTGAPADDKDKNEKPKQTPFDTLRDKLKDIDFRRRVEESLSKTKERLFAKDETTWRDAARAVFGLRPEDAKKETPAGFKKSLPTGPVVSRKV